jgi:hypothetical protein
MQEVTSQHRTMKPARPLLLCGAVAGPLFIVAAVVQMLTREGFDVTRHQLSLLSNGDLGWIQMANFVVNGLLFVAGAAGIRRALPGGPGRTWGPLLIGVFGVGLVVAGFFTADPAHGFPPGTDAAANAVSWHGLVHFIVAGVAFVALIAACLVFARRFAAQGQWGWTAYSAATGVLFLAAFAGIATGSSQAWINVAFVVMALLAFGWVSALSAKLLNEGT